MIINVLKTKIEKWNKENKKQAEKYWETEELTKVWTFFNREMKSG